MQEKIKIKAAIIETCTKENNNLQMQLDLLLDKIEEKKM